jgi:hypothetical protein
MGPRWRVHPRTSRNARGVRVRSYSAYDESPWRLDLASHFLSVTSHDFMDGKPEWDDFLSTPGHGSPTPFCTFPFSIRGKGRCCQSGACRRASSFRYLIWNGIREGARGNSGTDRTFPFPASLCNWHSEPTPASLETRFSTLSLRPTLFVPIFRHLSNFIPLSRLPPTNYSFKVVFRVFRDFHSVPAKLLMCSDGNIQAIPPQKKPPVRNWRLVTDHWLLATGHCFKTAR